MRNLNSINGKSSRLFKTILAPAAVLLLILGMSSNVTAQDLDDFKECAREDGVESIPYSSIRSSAARAESAKSGAESAAKSKFGVSALTGKMKEAKKKLETEQKKLVAAKKDLEQAKRDHPAVIDREEDAFEASERKVKDLQDDMEDLEKEIEYGIDHWKQLEISRGKVRVEFDKAIRALNDSERDPEEHIGDKPSDPEELREWNTKLTQLKGYIRTIRGELVEGQKGHLTAEQNAEKAVTNLKNLLR